MTQHIIKNLQELQQFAELIKAQIRVGDANIICLNGDLGAGKTEFSRLFINLFAEKNITVPSPTYNIVQIYELDSSTINHFDLYRIEDEEELHEIGFEELLESGVSLIEWPENAVDTLKRYEKQIINLKIEILDDESRRITIA